MFLCKECGMKCSYDSEDELCSHHTKDIKRKEQNRRKGTQNRNISDPKEKTQ